MTTERVLIHDWYVSISTSHLTHKELDLYTCVVHQSVHNFTVKSLKFDDVFQQFNFPRDKMI